MAFGIENFETLEEEIEPSVGKGSVAVGGCCCCVCYSTRACCAAGLE
jgi:hypothetical protein